MTIRHSYYDSLWVEISDTLDSDKVGFLKRSTEIMFGLKLATQSSNHERIRLLVDEFMELPTKIAMERFDELKTRAKRETLNTETRLKLARRIELRRFYAVHVLMQTCQMVNGFSDVPFTQFLYSLLDKLNNDALESGYDKLGARENAITQATFQFCLAMFANHGRPTFVPSLGLTEALIHTEFRDVPSGLVQLPHPAIFIEAPENSGLTVPNAESGLHELIGAFVVARDDSNSENRKFQVILIGRAKTTDIQMLDKVLFDDALFHFTFEFTSGSTVGECLKETTGGIGSWTSKVKASVEQIGNDGTNKVNEWRSDGFADCARFVLNTLLYITLPDSEIESAFSDSEIPSLIDKLSRSPKGSNKRAAINAQLKKKSHHKCMILGSSVKINRASHTCNDGTSHGSNHKLNVAFIRRGHWRNQPFGPGRKQTRIMWIRPTMVNPDGPMKITTYTVE